jgi:lantibiotic modifying enzyme
MYLFDTIDMHGDNTIVVGDNPLMIDLETLLQPSLPDDDIMSYRSVSQTLFLPSVKEIVPDAEDLEGTEEMDLSEKTWSERKKLIWKNEGTDSMGIVRKRLLLDKNHNSIVIGENVINAADYAPYMVKSFRKTYRYIAANQKDFLEAVKQCFQDKKLRVILRGSRKYDALMEDMAHPSNLQDGLVLD